MNDKPGSEWKGYSVQSLGRPCGDGRAAPREGELSPTMVEPLKALCDKLSAL
jgi:hypothetical protein